MSSAVNCFITATFGLPPRDQIEIVDRIATAMSEVGPQVREVMTTHAKFRQIGKRMLMSWQDGLAGLRDKRIYAMGVAELGEAFIGFSQPQSATPKRDVLGRSDLLPSRSRRK